MAVKKPYREELVQEIKVRANMKHFVPIHIKEVAKKIERSGHV